MIPDVLLAYGVGVVTGTLVVGAVATRVRHSPNLVEMAIDSAVQTTFIRAASEVCDEETCRDIKRRANEILDEHDMPKDPEWRYDPEGGEADG